MTTSAAEKINPKLGKRRDPPTTEAIVVKIDGKSYAEMFKKVKEKSTSVHKTKQ